ncbi:helix-turn-helix transcriptional regulator, partial [Ethanoligenens sp.]|uniref:helix-turn-helix transcriptional regulator n=1 Tax=Ethanoligenens sp. TaxID=2099655 RepID=UPI0039EC3427
MEQAEKLVEFLGEILGDAYEVVLQDVNPDNMKIVAIANGHVSGRSIGAPMTDLSLQMCSDESWKTKDYEGNYVGVTNDGKVLKSSTFFIKEDGKLLGMLCINQDTSRFQALSEEVLRLGGVEIPSMKKQKSALPKIENFSENISELTSHAIRDAMGPENQIPLNHLKQSERIKIVAYLEQRGVFMMRGAVSTVAEQLECSEASIYRY